MLMRRAMTRLEYTVIGEPMNLAVTLDKHNKKSGTRPSISSPLA